MKTARFVLDLNLHPLLKRNLRGQPVDLQFQGPQSVKHLVESMGIPHTEIRSLIANGKTIGLDYIVEDDDRLEIGEVGAENLSKEPRFVLDCHLGRLASHLRMLGLDCLYHNASKDDELVRISIEDQRILLTRDRLLLMHKVVTQGYLLRSLNPREQLHEVIERFRLADWVRPFARCIRCNHLLVPVEKETVLEKLEPLTKKFYHEFKLCPACEQLYWKGSHYERMLSVIDEITKP